ncbi:MAG TPA: hypothetical protein VGG63_18345 [Steroidobacteraceae bacterium]|jgi:hypothetical protein
MSSPSPITPDPEIRAQRIGSRLDHLWKLTESTEANFSKFLLLGNTGGAVATLSFMGTAAELRRMAGPRLALCLFVAGVIMCGITLAVRAVAVSDTYIRFLADAEEFRKGDISWDELVTRSSPTEGRTMLRVLAALTFSCLIGGAVAGAITVWAR